MKQTILRWLLLGLLMFVAGFVHAEGVCPPGMFPTNPPGAQGPVGCAPIPGYNSNQQQLQRRPPPPQWEPRWGAVATDATTGILGTATNTSSKREAEQAAIADCQSKGGSHCKMNLAYDNECVAMVVGAKGYNVNADTTVAEAVKAGMKTCTADGDPDCHAYYTACSLPVRIQ